MAVRRGTGAVRTPAALLGATAAMLAAVAAAPGVAHAGITGWQLDAIGAERAQEVATGEGVVVAVLDSGVGAHPDLDGHVLDGVSFVDGDPRRDQDGHGTDMAGQVLSVAPAASILPVQVTTGGDDFASGPVTEGIAWAVDNGADVVNISLAGKVAAPPEIDAIAYALDHDVVVVAGTGNDPDAEVGSPAYLPGVVAVSGFTESGEVWEGATTGPETVLSAPAADITGLVPDGPGTDAGYREGENGTSIATALTSGAAALIRSAYPEASAADVVNRLITTAVDAGEPGRDDVYGFGRLDAYAAVTADVPPVAENPLGAPDVGGPADAAEPVDGGMVGFSILFVAVFALVAVVAVAIVIVVVVAVARRRRRRADVGPRHPYGGPPPPGRPGP